VTNNPAPQEVNFLDFIKRITINKDENPGVIIINSHGFISAGTNEEFYAVEVYDKSATGEKEAEKKNND
jgi:flagellar basal body P-ring protein FlgI